jgi:hypothetical protein
MATPQYLLPPHNSPYRDSSARTSTTRVDMDDVPEVPETEHVPVPEDEQPAVVPEPKTPVPEQEPVPQTPQTAVTFLLVSGRRRTMSFDPDTTVGRVKELVWSAWPSGMSFVGPSTPDSRSVDLEWQDDRPPAPSYLRVLYLGKILQDDDTLASQ